jgi:hypothetical protein
VSDASAAAPSIVGRVVLFVLLVSLVAGMTWVSESGPDFGDPVIVLTGLAAAAGALLLTFCMHLKDEHRLVAAVALLPLLLVAIIIVLNLQDASALAGR